MDLHEKHCNSCHGDAEPLTPEQRNALLQALPNWHYDNSTKIISREFKFKNYYQTMAFVNAVAWLAHQENHHPDLLVSYNKVNINLTTHALGDLSENDCIMAAKIDQLCNAR